MPGVRRTRNNHQQSRSSISPQPGQILWLPPKDELKDEDDGGLDDGCYNHPVVILSPEPLNGIVEIMILTSFNEKDLAVRHPHDERARLAHLPIRPSPSHPDNKILLRLQGKKSLHKNSYVKTESLLSVPLSTLRPHVDGKIFILTKSSYRELVHYSNFTPATSSTMRPVPAYNNRVAQAPHVISQPAVIPSSSRPSDRCHESPGTYQIGDEERQLQSYDRYTNTQSTSYTQYNAHSYRTFPGHAKIPSGPPTGASLSPQTPRYTPYYPPNPNSLGGSASDSNKSGSLIPALVIVIILAALVGAASYGLYWATPLAIEAAKGAAKIAWSWIQGHVWSL